MKPINWNLGHLKPRAEAVFNKQSTTNLAMADFVVDWFKIG